MNQTFIPLCDIHNYLDPRLWNICTAAILDGTKHSGLITPCINDINAWAKQTREITTAIEYHGLSGLMNTLAKHHHINLPLPVSIIVKANAAKHLQRWQAINDVLQFINNETAHEVRFCLLKGSALATQIYTEPYHRAMSDIDIMCSPDKAHILYEQCLKSSFSAVTEEDHNPLIHHHLPALSKQMGRHRIFLEIHTHALSYDLCEQLYWQDINTRFRTIVINTEHYLTLHHEAMLLQLCVHAFARDQVIKLSNIVDIFRYAILFEDSIDWKELIHNRSKIILTLRYSRLLLKLPEQVLPQIKPISNQEAKKISGLGEGMMPLREFYNQSISFSERLKALFLPSPWWQRVFYSVEPASPGPLWKNTGLKSPLLTRYVLHPYRVAYWVVTKFLLPKLFIKFSPKLNRQK